MLSILASPRRSKVFAQSFIPISKFLNSRSQEMGTCCSKRKRSDAAVIHNASPRISHELTTNGHASNVSKDSLPNSVKSRTEVFPLKKSKSKNTCPPGGNAQECPASTGLTRMRERTLSRSSGLVATSGVSEAVAGRRTAPLLRETRFAIAGENLSGESRISAQRAAVKSSASNIMPATKELVHSKENQPTNEAFPSNVLDLRKEVKTVSPSARSPKLSLNSLVPPSKSSSGFFAEVGGDDPTDGTASIYPDELNRSPETLVFEIRNAMVDGSEGSAGLEGQDKCKHLHFREAQETPSTRPASRVKRSRSSDQIMDSDTTCFLRRRSSGGSTGGFESSFLNGISLDEGCQRFNVLGDALRNGAGVSSTGSYLLESSCGIAEHMSEECVARREGIAPSWDIHDSCKVKRPENIDTQRCIVAKIESKEIDEVMELAVEQDRRLALIFEGLRNSKVKETRSERAEGAWEFGLEHEDNRLSADFFELKNRYLHPYTTTVALRTEDPERVDDCGSTEAGSREDEGQSGASFGANSTTEVDEGEDGFQDSSAGVSLTSHADARGQKEGSQIFVSTSSDNGVAKTFELAGSTASLNASVETTASTPSKTYHTRRLIPVSQQLSFQDMDEDCESDSETFEFKHAVSIFSQENMACLRGRAIEETASERNELNEEAQFPHQQNRVSLALTDEEDEEEELSRSQEISVVSTGDAILLSASNSEELHLIPSKSYVRNNSISRSPKCSQMQPTKENSNQQQQQSALSIEDIILLLENDELEEEKRLAFLMSIKSSCLASDFGSESSFEFKVKSSSSTPHSTPSTPMLSAGSTPRRITQMKPIALTPEEIAEIWGVFEQR